METEITVGMGSYEVRRQGCLLSVVGIGSCVAVIIFDPEAKVYGLAHVMLPYRNENEATNPNKFADSAIPSMIRAMIGIGADKGHMKAKIAGGAHMFPTLKKDSITINVRNIEAVKATLKNEGIPIVAEDIGGNFGRTVKCNTATGETKVLIRCTSQVRDL